MIKNYLYNGWNVQVILKSFYTISKKEYEPKQQHLARDFESPQLAILCEKLSWPQILDRFKLPLYPSWSLGNA